MFGVVMSADSQPIEALDGQTRILVPEGRLRKCPIVVRNEGGSPDSPDTLAPKKSTGAQRRIG
jgi:hypothetical protein